MIEDGAERDGRWLDWGKVWCIVSLEVKVMLLPLSRASQMFQRAPAAVGRSRDGIDTYNRETS